MNYLAIVASTAVYMVVGMLWYSPKLYGNQWLKLIGKNMKDLNKAKMGPIYTMTVLSGLVRAYILSYMFAILSVTTVMYAIQLSFILWVAFTYTGIYVSNAFEGKSTKLTLINSGYHLVTTVLMGIILVLWR